jgi:cysteine-rich repeat protein
MKGVCVCENCGDGTVDDDEDCDDGKDNGTEESECSINCREIKCGDGKVQGDEECDDGNVKRLDGCDAMCKYELAHRFSSMGIKRGDPPSWCYYDANRFAEAFSDEIRIMGVMPLDILSIVNDTMSSGIYAGDENLVLHFLDSSDTTMKTADDEISIAVYQGNLGPGNWTAEEPIDFPVYIDSEFVNRDGTPKEYHEIPAQQLGAGKVISSEPETIEMLGLQGVYRVFNFKIQLVFDYELQSKPDVPGFGEGDFDEDISIDEKPMSLNDRLKLPAESGISPKGLYCGAIEAGAVDDPVTMVDMSGGMSPTTMMDDPMAMMANMCCKNNGYGPSNDPMYRGCAPNDVVGVDCDTQANIMRYGCTVCINRENFSMDNPGQFGSDCGLMDSDPESCFTVIQGIDFDIDAYGDDENESWSSLFEFDARRIRLYGVARSN